MLLGNCRVHAKVYLRNDMACSGRAGEQERWVEAFFGAGPTYSYIGSTLTLGTDSARIDFLPRISGEASAAAAGP